MHLPMVDLSLAMSFNTCLNKSMTLQLFSNFNVSFAEKSTASFEVYRRLPGAEVKTQVNLKFTFISLGLCIIRRLIQYNLKSYFHEVETLPSFNLVTPKASSLTSGRGPDSIQQDSERDQIFYGNKNITHCYIILDKKMYERDKAQASGCQSTSKSLLLQINF